MFYEEKVVNGVLWWRGTPNGEWTQKTLEQLTRMLIDAREEINALYEVEAGASL